MSELEREEYLEWAKARAREYLERGDLTNTVASLGSDLDKRPGDFPSSGPLMLLVFKDILDGNTAGVRRWIEGFR
jgi:hypothetical protein